MMLLHGLPASLAVTDTSQAASCIVPTSTMPVVSKYSSVPQSALKAVSRAVDRRRGSQQCLSNRRDGLRRYPARLHRTLG